VTAVSLEALAVTDSTQIGQARRAAARLAAELALSDEHRGEVAIIATELATNLVRYAQNGRLLLQSVRRADGAYVQMLAVDSGPGIADVQRSLQDGVSTGGTPGNGLGAVRRLSDVFDIYSTVGRGTLVLSRVGASTPKRQRHTYEWGAVSTPAPKETVCGDAWRVSDADGTLTVLVADGLGHGVLAAEASNRAADLFDAHTPSDPAAFCESAHKRLAGSRGAAIAVAHAGSNGRVLYAGVGNIAGSIVTDGKGRGLASQNGTAGVQIRRVQRFEYDWPEDATLVMHSDGLTNRWSIGDYPGLSARHAAVIAGVLHRDYVRGRDDATVVVVKRKTKGGKA
jgi:anti-sigma regulatory factor (Ser/Thr protein kinase)